jgi:hypothetical protein
MEELAENFGTSVDAAAGLEEQRQLTLKLGHKYSCGQFLVKFVLHD